MDFEITVMSDEDYEDLIAEVLYKGEFFCLLSQEDGIEHLRMAIHPRKDGKAWDFGVKEFQLMFKAAVERLKGPRRLLNKDPQT